MADKIKDGGAAFPNAGYDGPDNCADPVPGMTMRDWFAGQALAGICANPNWQPTDVASVAQDAYAHADAMLAAREGGDA